MAYDKKGEPVIERKPRRILPPEKFAGLKQLNMGVNLLNIGVNQLNMGN